MKSAIRELYEGGFCPADRQSMLSEEFLQVLEYQERHENDLVSTLTEAQKEIFEKYKDCASEVGLEDEFQAFSLGFRMGLRLMGEAAQD